MTEFFDDLEQRDPAERERQLMAALPGLVEHARTNTGAFAEILKDIDPKAITSRAALAKLPVTRKHELLERQQARRAEDPFGGFSAIGRAPQMRRVYASPGPI